MIDVRLPREGSTTMAAGVVLEWHVAEGDEVGEGQVLVEIETDKVSFEIAAPGAGTVRQRCADVGQEVEVGAVLLRIGAPDEPIPVDEPTGAVPDGPGEPDPGSRGQRGPVEVAPVPRARDAGSLRASPAARRRARELGLELTALSGTGPLGRITSADVEAAGSRGSAGRRDRATAAVVDQDDLLAGLIGHRAVVARRMAQAASETAAVTLMLRADVTRIMRTEGASLIDVVVHEAARCVGRHPALNATLTREGIVTHARVGLGYAVDGARGLIVPVVRDADVLPLAEFAAARRRVVRAALDATLVPADLDGGTFTVSNLGSTGMEFFTPIITPGQTAVLGLGATVPTVVPTHDGSGFGVRPLIGLSLTFDHRIVDGAEAGRYLQDLAATLAGWPEAR